MSSGVVERETIDVADGTKMTLHVARPPLMRAGTPGILVFQEAYGVNAHIRDVVARFARQGFVAVAPELYHRTAPGFEGRYDDLEGARAHAARMTEEGLLADVAAAFAWLQSQPMVAKDRIAGIGFCMGGRVSYVANSAVPLRAAISFYGGGIAPGLLHLAGKQHAPLLMFWGGLDAHIGPEQYRAVSDALREAKKPYECVVFSYADHGFFCDARPSYSESAARQAWVLSLEFLRVNGVLEGAGA